MQQNNFSKIIQFTEILDSVIYTLEKTDEKLYIPTQVKDITWSADAFKKCYRKLLFKMNPGEGIIVGQTKRQEGMYIPKGGGARANDYEDYEAAYLKISKVYAFWIAYTSMNKQVLIPKESNYTIV
jgi:hypothetical protein